MHLDDDDDEVEEDAEREEEEEKEEDSVSDKVASVVTSDDLRCRFCSCKFSRKLDLARKGESNSLENSI
jgi:hypothetical protein